MSLRPEHISRLVALNLPAEALKEVLAVFAESHEPSAAAKRQARRRAKKVAPYEEESVTSHAPRAYMRAPGLCGEEVIEVISSLRSDKIPNPKTRTDLQIALGDELAAEVIAHRKVMRKPLIPSAASRLAKQFLATGQPEDAARMMIDKGWQGFEASWFTKARESPKHAREQQLSFAERMEAFVNRGSENDQDDSRCPPIIDGNVFVLSGRG